MTVELLGKLDSLLRPLIERLSRDWYSSPLLHSFSFWCPTFLLVPFFSFLLLHFPNAISSQNTSDKHIDFSRSNVCCDGSPPPTALGGCFCFAFFAVFPSLRGLDDVFRVGEDCFYFASVDQLLRRDDAEDEVLWKEARRSPSSQGFSWLIKDSCKAMWQLWQISCRRSE